MKPLLKWAGGKRHIAEKLLTFFPEDWRDGTYYEPFFGGGAMLMHLEPASAHVSDLNSRLINFYKHVKFEPQELLEKIYEKAKAFDIEESGEKKSFYLQMRSDFNESNYESLESSVMLYLLNKLCFNGLYRENSKGKFNVPFGQKEKFPEILANDFQDLSKLLQTVEISNLHFAEAVQDAKEGDFVYFDPPYVPMQATSSFTSYQAGGFGLEAQSELADLMLTLKARGVKALASNSSADLCYEIFKEHNLLEIQAPRMVSATSAGRGTIKELVIMNY
jgi:DNA adenine methylase